MKTKISFEGLLPALGYMAIYIGLQVLCYLFGFWAFDEVSESVYFESMPFVLLVSSIGVVIAYICMFAAKGKNIAGELALKKFNPLSLIPAILAGLALGGFITLWKATFPFPVEWMWSHDEYDFFPMMSDMTVYGVVFSMVILPIAREIVFRSVVYKKLRTGLPVSLSVLISALLFGVTACNPIGGIELFCIGVVAAVLFEWTGSFWVTLIFHIAYNFLYHNFAYFTDDLTPEYLFWMILCIAVVVITMIVAVVGTVKEDWELKAYEMKKAARQSAANQSERKVTMPPQKKVETGTVNSTQKGMVNHGVVVEDTLNLDD